MAAVAPAELRPALAAALKGAGKAGNKAEAAFQRGLAALAQWVEKEGQRPVPRGAVVEVEVEVEVDGEAEPAPEKTWGKRPPWDHHEECDKTHDEGGTRTCDLIERYGPNSERDDY